MKDQYIINVKGVEYLSAEEMKWIHEREEMFAVDMQAMRRKYPQEMALLIGKSYSEGDLQEDIERSFSNFFKKLPAVDHTKKVQKKLGDIWKRTVEKHARSYERTKLQGPFREAASKT